jgi:hypothetical protein
MQNKCRIMATKKLKHIIGSSSRAKVLHNRQLYVVKKKLNRKLATENAIITQAVTGKTIVIITSENYFKKVHSFLAANNFNALTKDPTDIVKKLIHKTMQEIIYRRMPDKTLDTNEGHATQS